MAVSDIYLVTDRINPVSTADVDRLEETIGSLPVGYREFMERCGADGELCSEIRVWNPQQIMKCVDEERENHTFDRYARFSIPAEIEASDFDELWTFAATVDGDTLVYFPRLRGILFSIWHNADEISRHDEAFTNISKLTSGGTVVHPFPYFDPEGPHRSHKSFQVQTTDGTQNVADWIRDYWSARGMDPHCIRMPKESYSDAIYVFVQSLGAMISTVTDDDEEVYGDVTFDSGHEQSIEEFVRALEAEFAN